MKFLPVIFKQNLPSDDVCWTVIIFSKTAAGKVLVDFLRSFHAVPIIALNFKYDIVKLEF